MLVTEICRSQVSGAGLTPVDDVIRGVAWSLLRRYGRQERVRAVGRRAIRSVDGFCAHQSTRDAQRATRPHAVG